MEILAQIEAMREGLAAQQTATGDAADLAHLARAAQRVALEAAGVAEAREELERALAAPPAAQEHPLRVTR